jgi:hypothetical protein
MGISEWTLSFLQATESQVSLLPGVGDKPQNGRLTKIISNTVLINITIPENVAE